MVGRCASGPYLDQEDGPLVLKATTFVAMQCKRSYSLFKPRRVICCVFPDCIGRILAVRTRTIVEGGLGKLHNAGQAVPQGVPLLLFVLVDVNEETLGIRDNLMRG